MVLSLRYQFKIFNKIITLNYEQSLFKTIEK
jgi:hypothetical protein